MVDLEKQIMVFPRIFPPSASNTACVDKILQQEVVSHIFVVVFLAYLGTRSFDLLSGKRKKIRLNGGRRPIFPF